MCSRKGAYFLFFELADDRRITLAIDPALNWRVINTNVLENVSQTDDLDSEWYRRTIHS